MQTLCGSWFSAGQACGVSSKQRRRGSTFEGDGWGATVSLGAASAQPKSLSDRVALDRYEDGEVIIDRHGMRVRGQRLPHHRGGAEERLCSSFLDGLGYSGNRQRAIDGESRIARKQALSAGPQGFGYVPQSSNALIAVDVRDDDDNLSIASTASKASKGDTQAHEESHQLARAAPRSKPSASVRNSTDDVHIETWLRTGKTSPRRTATTAPPPVPPSLAKARASGMPRSQAEKVLDQYTMTDIVPMLRKVRPLGKGNGGVVWQANFDDGKHRVPVALKQVPVTEDEDKQAMVVHEMRTMADVKHPCIVLCHKVFFSNSTFNLVMELVNGGSLLDLMKASETRIPLDAIGAVCSALLRALAYLHETHKVMHRDVKPGNILLSIDGSVKLADLGMCSKPSELPSQKWVGTVTYMSPERMTGDEYTFSSDVWSAGLVAAEAALGVYPFMLMAQHKNPSAQLEFWDLLDLLVSGTTTTGDLLRQECPAAGEDFVNWVEACMHKDDELRPSAAAVLEMPWLAGADAEAQRGSLRCWVQDAVRAWQKELGDAHSDSVVPSCGVAERACGVAAAAEDKPSALQGVVDSVSSLFV
uniref:mitogen-activated protein kinase kinase n=1 Tax=Hemiselmis andersenii TaxID=464988 RepID=A0A6U4MRS9_HEMAN|mmetsp:Transcript_5173/g.11988  ORF Transcript_5173/g.11988 Transcript_5173/m.11988 type:complete len:588 (+) Transcript_5173:508-2271(+)